MLSDRQWEWLQGELNLADDQRDEADEKFQRLGTVKAVELEYLRRELNERILGVTRVTITGAVSVSFGSLASLEAWIKRVEAGPDDPSSPEEVPVGPGAVPGGITTIGIDPSAVQERRLVRRPRHPDLW